MVVKFDDGRAYVLRSWAQLQDAADRLTAADLESMTPVIADFFP